MNASFSNILFLEFIEEQISKEEKVDEEALVKLVDMGFPRERSSKALRLNKYEAHSYLCNNNSTSVFSTKKYLKLSLNDMPFTNICKRTVIFRMSTMDAIQWMLENETEPEEEPPVSDIKPDIPLSAKGAVSSKELLSEATNVSAHASYIHIGMTNSN